MRERGFSALLLAIFRETCGGMDTVLRCEARSTAHQVKRDLSEQGVDDPDEPRVLDPRLA